MNYRSTLWYNIYGYSEAASAIFDEDFGLSDAESSEEETEELYAFLGEPVVESAAVDNITRSIGDSLPLPEIVM